MSFNKKGSHNEAINKTESIKNQHKVQEVQNKEHANQKLANVLHDHKERKLSRGSADIARVNSTHGGSNFEHSKGAQKNRDHKKAK